jgi:hypothetical protein
MAKMTWLGEDAAHQREDGSGMGPGYVLIFGGRFDKGKAVSITDWRVINKAINMSSFEVELTAAEQEQYDDEHMPEPADEAPEPLDASRGQAKRRPPGRPPKVKPHVDAQEPG